MNANQAFKILEIEKKFPIDEEQVKKQYRIKAKENHPDITGEEDQMKLINEAYDWLIKNISKINETNIKQHTYDNYITTDEIIKTFCQLYLNESNIGKRKDMLYKTLKVLISKTPLEEIKKII